MSEPTVKNVPPVPPQMPAPAPAAAPGGEPATVDELGFEAGVQLSFWQQPFVQNILPFLTSLALHAGLLLLGIMTYQVAKVSWRTRRADYRSESDMGSDEGDLGGIPHPGLGGDPTARRRAEHRPQPSPTPRAGQRKKGDAVAAAAMGGGEKTAGKPSSAPAAPREGSAACAGYGTGTGDGSGELAPSARQGGGGGSASRAVHGTPFQRHQGGLCLRRVRIHDDQVRHPPHGDSQGRRRSAPRPVLLVIFFQEDQAAFIDKSLITATPRTNARPTSSRPHRPAWNHRSLPVSNWPSTPTAAHLPAHGRRVPRQRQGRQLHQRANKDKTVKINTIAS